MSLILIVYPKGYTIRVGGIRKYEGRLVIKLQERLIVYAKQNGSFKLTPKQRRRFKQKLQHIQKRLRAENSN